MPWLVVLGTGRWGYADSSRTMRNFPAGVHEVDEETADFARRANSPSLLLFERKPVIVRRALDGPLRLEHLRLPADGSVLLHEEREEKREDLALDLPMIPLDYPCGRCSASFPSEGARDRHAEFHH